MVIIWWYISRPRLIQGFSQIFWWGGGDLLSGKIFGLCQGQSHMGGLASGTESDEGDLEKIVRCAKNAPHSKIRANFGILNIK